VIVRSEGADLVLVRQADHALLSGWLASIWGSPPWQPPEPRLSTVLGARLHDLPWTAFDEDLPLRPDGHPYSFEQVPRAISTRFYVSGLDAIESIDAYAGLLGSLHFSGFYVSHWGWRHWAGSSQLAGEEKAAVDRFVAHELDRQERLRCRLGLDAEGDHRLRCNYMWLQLWDRISLDICRRGFHGVTENYPSVPLTYAKDSGSISLRIELAGPDECRLDPYPLVANPYRTVLLCARVPADLVADGDGLAGRFAAASCEAVPVTFRPA
jgi:hypothetical protein